MAVEQPGSRVLERAVMHEAAAWLEQLKSDDLTDAAFEQWLCWLSASDTHAHIYWLMEELWQAFDAITSARWPSPEELRMDSSIATEDVEAWFTKHSAP